METDTISAEVMLKSKSSKSMIDTEADKITSQNIEQFRPDSKTVEATKHKLQELGFEVTIVCRRNTNHTRETRII